MEEISYVRSGEISELPRFVPRQEVCFEIHLHQLSLVWERKLPWERRYKGADIVLVILNDYGLLVSGELLSISPIRHRQYDRLHLTICDSEEICQNFLFYFIIARHMQLLRFWIMLLVTRSSDTSIPMNCSPRRT